MVNYMCTVTSPDVLLTNTSAVYHIPCTRSPRSHAFVCLVADKLPQIDWSGTRSFQSSGCVVTDQTVLYPRIVPWHISVIPLESSRNVGLLYNSHFAEQNVVKNAADIANLPGRTSLLTDPLKPTHFIEACMRSSKVWSKGWFVRHRGLCLMVSKHLLASFLAESAKVAGCALQV